MKERVEFDLDKFIARLERQNVIEFSDIDLLVVLLTEALAREKRLREVLKEAPALLEHQAVRAREQRYHPSTALRYSEMLLGLAYEIREMQRAALAGEGEEQPT